MHKKRQSHRRFQYRGSCDVGFYNGVRTHLALDKDTPLSRPAQIVGRIVSVTWLGGLHRQYVWMA